MNNSKRYCTLVLVILFGALGGCAAYQKCGFGGCPGDKELTAAVESAFKDHAELQPPNLINIQTVDHTVYLYGLVDTDIQRLMAESLGAAGAGRDQGRQLDQPPGKCFLNIRSHVQPPRPAPTRPSSSSSVRQ